MPPSVADSLAYEFKQEIANRYFGFRRLIEEDKLSLAERIGQYAFILEKRISFDLIRIYILLRDEELIGEFLALANLPERLFYDPYLAESATIRLRVFEGVSFRGLTRKGRFTNAVIDCYALLVEHCGQYRAKFAELVAAQEEISAEIDLFYRENDLGSIIGFLRGLGDPLVSGEMQGGMEPGLAQDLDRKLRIEPPEPVSRFLPVIPPPPPLPAVKYRLKAICARAFRRQDREFIDYLAAGSWFRRHERRSFVPR